MRILFPGSFDPFTLGHLDLLKRIENKNNNIIISILKNIDKKGLISFDDRKSLIQDICKKYLEFPIDVKISTGAVVDLAVKENIDFILKGVRNSNDFFYETEMALINEKLSNIPTLLLSSSPEYAMVSSSRAKELYMLNKNIDFMVPNEIIEFLNKTK